MNQPEVDQRLEMIRFTQIFERTVAHSRRDIHGAVEGLLKSTLVQTWTAVETLTQDLWESVLNEQPKYLAPLSGKGPSDKKVDLHLLARENFDTASKMGTILRTKFNFTVLDDIRKAYSLAFASDREQIDAALSSESLDMLALVRNLIVHKDGKVDEKFVKESGGFTGLSQLSRSPVGTQIAFDGVVVADVVPPAVKDASNLVKAVDDWLLAHPI